ALLGVPGVVERGGAESVIADQDALFEEGGQRRTIEGQHRGGIAVPDPHQAFPDAFGVGEDRGSWASSRDSARSHRRAGALAPGLGGGAAEALKRLTTNPGLTPSGEVWRQRRCGGPATHLVSGALRG